jgi:hypothetical protein
MYIVCGNNIFVRQVGFRPMHAALQKQAPQARKTGAGPA